MVEKGPFQNVLVGYFVPSSVTELLNFWDILDQITVYESVIFAAANEVAQDSD